MDGCQMSRWGKSSCDATSHGILHTPMHTSTQRWVTRPANSPLHSLCFLSCQGTGLLMLRLMQVRRMTLPSLGGLFPTGPLTVTATQILQTDIVAADAVENFLSPFRGPLQTERCVTLSLRTSHLSPDPPRLPCHGAPPFRKKVSSIP
jgi:hypothetical protein